MTPPVRLANSRSDTEDLDHEAAAEAARRLALYVDYLRASIMLPPEGPAAHRSTRSASAS
jgi:hypothetical protein